MCLDFVFFSRYHGNDCVSLEYSTVCTINGRAKKKEFSVTAILSS